MPAPPHLLSSRLREGPGEGEPAGPGAGSRRRHRHRVDKSLSTRHSHPADAERECRPLPTRPICRHCRRQMPTVRARRRGVGIFDPRVGMSRRCASRRPSVTGSAVGGPRRFFRRARNKSGHDDIGTGRAACPATERGAETSGAPTFPLWEIWYRARPGSRAIFSFRSFFRFPIFRLVPPRRNRLH